MRLKALVHSAELAGGCTEVPACSPAPIHKPLMETSSQSLHRWALAPKRQLGASACPCACVYWRWNEAELWCIVITAAGGGHPKRAEDAAGRGCVHGGDLPPQPHPGAAGASLTHQCAVLALIPLHWSCSLKADRLWPHPPLQKRLGMCTAQQLQAPSHAILRHGFKPGMSLQRAAPSNLQIASILLCTFNNWVHLCRAATDEHQPLQPGLRLQDQGARRRRRTWQQRQRGALISF